MCTIMCVWCLQRPEKGRERNNNLNTMQFLYIQNLGHRDPVSFIVYVQYLLHTAVIC